MPAVFRSKLASAYYLTPVFALAGNALFVVPEELKLPRESRSRARLSPVIPVSDRCIRWDGVEGPGAAPAGGRLMIRLKVKNCGSRVWPDDVWGGPADHWGAHAVRFGARWVFDGVTTGEHKDWRASLPHAVLGGEHLETTLYVPTPSKPGRYVVEIDAVQELVAWFSDTGGKRLRLGVEVR
jgi:hypothetical protein